MRLLLALGGSLRQCSVAYAGFAASGSRCSTGPGAISIAWRRRNMANLTGNRVHGKMLRLAEVGQLMAVGQYHDLVVLPLV